MPCQLTTFRSDNLLEACRSTTVSRSGAFRIRRKTLSADKVLVLGLGQQARRGWGRWRAFGHPTVVSSPSKH